METEAKSNPKDPRALTLDIFDYDSFRDFLREATAQLKSQGLYSNRKFAKLSQIASPTFINRVIQNKKSLNPDTAYRIARALGLTRYESHYFFLLVKKEKALEPLERAIVEGLIDQIKQLGRGGREGVLTVKVPISDL